MARLRNSRPQPVAKEQARVKLNSTLPPHLRWQTENVCRAWADKHKTGMREGHKTTKSQPG